MIRSLVASNHAVANGNGLRRNLSRENLEKAKADGDCMWIDLVDPEEEEIDWLGSQFNLSISVIEDLEREDRRPSLLVYPTYLFLSLFEPQIEGYQVLGREIHCILGDTFFITVRTEDTEVVDDAYDRAAQTASDWDEGMSYFLYLTCQHVIDAYYPLLDRMSIQLNRLEERLMIGSVEKGARKPVYEMKRQLIHLRQMIAPQREVVSNMVGEQRLIGEDTLDLFRHLYERLLRIYDLIDAQRDIANNVLDMIENQESRRLVDAVNRLTIFSMIFLPLTFFSALFELNFATTADPVVLPISGGAMLALVILLMIVSAAGMFVLFKRRGWL